MAIAQDQRAVLELIINRVPSGESLVVLRGNDTLVTVEALQKAGLRGFAGRRDTVGSEEFVSLRSLAPDVTFSVDEIELRLTLTASPDLMGLTVRDLRSAAPPGLVYREDTSSFVNYSANWHSNRQFDLFAESATSVRGLSIYNTVSANRQSVTRGLTSVTFDQRRPMRRWTIGDSLAYSGPLGGDCLDRGPQRLEGIRHRSLFRPLPDAVALDADRGAFGDGGLRQRPGRQSGARDARTTGPQESPAHDGTKRRARRRARCVWSDARAVVHLLPDDDGALTRRPRLSVTTSASAGWAWATRVGTIARRCCWRGIVWASPIRSRPAAASSSTLDACSAAAPQSTFDCRLVRSKPRAR